MAVNGTVGGGGVSPVAGPGGPRFTRQGYLILALFVFAAALVFALIMWSNSGRKPELHEDTGGYGPNLAFERPAEPRPVNHPLPMPMPMVASTPVLLQPPPRPAMRSPRQCCRIAAPTRLPAAPRRRCAAGIGEQPGQRRR